MEKAELADIQSAVLRSVMRSRIYDLVRETPLTLSPIISKETNNQVYLKREDAQDVYSFKVRGAYHKMTSLPQASLKRGIVAASAGNHAQGVALAAKKLKCKASIVMPKRTQEIKISAVRALEARVILQGHSFDEANAFAKNFAKKKGAVFIPPFDDIDVIAGNGTIAAEILRQHPAPIDTIFCAIGGGGLISGIASYIKALNPDIKIIGVESDESNSMSASLAAGKPIQLDYVGTFADAVAVKKPGRLTFALVQALVDEVITVSNDELCAAIKDLYKDTRIIFEPAGALAVAGLKKYTAAHQIKNNKLIALACGANMDFDRLRFVVERTEIGEQKEALFAVTIPEQPGSFRKFCTLLEQRNITEFNYRLDDKSDAHIFVGVETQKKSDRKKLEKTLQKAGLPVIDLTDNEMAKVHMRHLVGGRADATHELLYRFEFPEYQGALSNFLNLLNQSRKNWNISLFHYRNNGGDTGRILAGIQVPPKERTLFKKTLQKLDYPHWEETDNPAYQLFLRGDR